MEVKEKICPEDLPQNVLDFHIALSDYLFVKTKEAK